jgi:3-deoxy-D-arabino-heptulosonate 7-phosphate (DAHP) synthase class II
LFDQIETEGVVPCAYAYNTILMAFITGGYAAMERITQWNLAFIEHSEQGDGYMELAQRVASVGLVGTQWRTQKLAKAWAEATINSNNSI